MSGKVAVAVLASLLAVLRNAALTRVVLFLNRQQEWTQLDLLIPLGILRISF